MPHPATRTKQKKTFHSNSFDVESKSHGLLTSIVSVSYSTKAPNWIVLYWNAGLAMTYKIVSVFLIT